MSMLVSLEEWAKLNVSFPISKATLTAWAKSGRLFPKPVKMGRRWAVKSDAQYINPEIKIPKEIIDPLVMRIFKNGSKAA